MTQKYTHCKTCNSRLRPKGQTLDEYPGTKAHSANGLCSGCNTNKLRNKTPLTDPKPAHVIEHLHYIHARRKRGIPTEGIKP